MDALEQWVSTIAGQGILARIIIACVLVAVIAVVCHIVVRWLNFLMSRGEHPLPQSSIFVNIVRGIIWGLGACLILDACFNVNVTALIAALGVGGIAISLGFQDTLSNLIGGVQVSLGRIVQPGDNIQVGTNTGVVQDVTWRHTTIKNRLGQTIMIPNSVISTTAVVHLPPIERVKVSFVAGTHADLDSVAYKAEQAAVASLEGVATIVEEPKVTFSEVRETGLVGSIVLVIDDSSKAGAAADAVTRAIAPILRA